MPDPDAIWRAVADAEARVAVARTRAVEAEAAHQVAAERLQFIVPQWQDAQTQRDRRMQLTSELRVAESEATGYARELERLDQELEMIARAHDEVVPLRARMAALSAVRDALVAQEQLAVAESRRQALMERVSAYAEEEAKLAERAARLETAPALERETTAQLQTLRNTLAETERALDEERTAWATQAEVAAAERRLARIQAALNDAGAVTTQRAHLAARLQDATTQLAALPTGYDAAVHAALKGDATELQELETRVARVSGLVDRELTTRTERTRVLAARDVARARMISLEAQCASLGMDDGVYGTVRERYEAAATEARRAEVEAVSAIGEADRARAALDSAEQARRELSRLQGTLETLETEKRLHDELDRALTDLRTDLNFQLRPELAEIASRFLDDLTDGRYTHLEFDEDYRLTVMEDGLPKSVISGGEEDLCNLVLRLAISQMIAERAGQAFSLLILDEVFGSLDEARRANVVELLRRLNDRFEQVVVITHIEQVREGLDRLLLVRFDEARGCSVVSGATVAPMADEADTAEAVVSDMLTLSEA
ncbi:MAG: hypothetical protein EBV77_04295 [Gemmatimonadaceae bacterium]|nr:hypothetical protein [Gemmatimonadaceae bacterium]